MAQLRDAKTSQLVAEGDPIAIALMARSLGEQDVLFDGVASEHQPDAFDPQAVIQSHEERLEGLRLALAAEGDGEGKDGLEQAVTAAESVELMVEQTCDQARAVLESARDDSIDTLAPVSLD